MPVEIFEFRIQIFGAKSVVGVPTTQPPCFAFMETTYQSLPCFGKKVKWFHFLEINKRHFHFGNTLHKINNLKTLED